MQRSTQRSTCQPIAEFVTSLDNTTENCTIHFDYVITKPECGHMGKVSQVIVGNTSTQYQNTWISFVSEDIPESGEVILECTLREYVYSRVDVEVRS
jgi:hypothetical protein